MGIFGGGLLWLCQCVVVTMLSATAQAQTGNGGAGSPAWTVQDYHQCSASCGSGVQAPRVVCAVDGQAVDLLMCAALPPPNFESRACNAIACPPDWKAAPFFSDCSVTCGTGVRTRTVTCEQISALGFPRTLDESECDATTRPSSSENCGGGTQCPPYWELSLGECSVTCGGDGELRSELACLQRLPSGEIRPATQELCPAERPSPEVVRCGMQACPAEWFVPNFGPCICTGQNGVQRRDILCRQRRNGTDNVVSASNCQGPRPQVVLSRICSPSVPCATPPIPSTRELNTTSGNIAPFNYTATWNPCSTSCEQSQTVQCVRQATGQAVATRFCSQAGMVQPVPATRRCIDSQGKYVWRAEAWPDCAKTCAPVSRVVYCTDLTTGRRARECPLCLKPIDSKPCNHFSCLPADQCRDSGDFCSLITSLFLCDNLGIHCCRSCRDQPITRGR